MISTDDPQHHAGQLIEHETQGRWTVMQAPERVYFRGTFYEWALRNNETGLIPASTYRVRRSSITWLLGMKNVRVRA